MPANSNTADVGVQDLVKRFQDAYQSAEQGLGRFNLAIFGETGVGKSTLINAVFSAEVAKTGTGRPVTLKTEYYEHPSGYFGVYDSDGFELGQEGSEILDKVREVIRGKRARPLEEQVHVIWYCLHAGGQRFVDSQAQFIVELAEEGIPILFVLTQTRKRDGRTHPDALALAESVRERHLPLSPDNRVFFTMAKRDDFSDFETHGLHELLDATFRVAPEGVLSALTAAQKIDVKKKVVEARKTVRPAAGAAAGAAPIPFSDAGLLVPLQVAMMGKIGAVFGLGIKKGTLATLAGAAFTGGGVVQAGKYLVTNLLKLVPGGNVAGGVIRASVASSLTYSVGEAWIAVCARLYSSGPAAAETLPVDEMRRLFMEEFKKRARAAQATTR